MKYKRKQQRAERITLLHPRSALQHTIAEKQVR